MTLWLVSLLPLAAGAVLWVAGRRLGRTGLGVAAAAALALIAALAGWGAVAGARTTHRWGAGLELHLVVDDPASVVMVLVPLVALVVVAYAAAHEEGRALRRLLATLVAFTGAMELLVLAGDMLTLLIGWELVGAFSWALIGHQWWQADKPEAAASAFVATRAGDLGLFAAAGAALVGTGSLAYESLPSLEGGWLHLFVAGVVLAAAAKSAQVPFSPWLFSAMGGPTSVSALLHAATMVAAGAFLLVRLHPALDAAGWFAPVVIGLGLATALAGGVVAALQRHAKKLLAASTSAQYGLMFVAAGAGAPAVALAHLVAHAALKAGLFLSAGVAMEAVASPMLDRMRLGRALPRVAAFSALGALALAAVPPLGGAWTKEEVVAAAGHRAAWLAVAVAGAGALSTFYAARFWLLAFGRSSGRAESPLARWPQLVEVAAVAAFGLASAGLGLLWLPGAGGVVERLAGGELPAGSTWEPALSLALVVAAAYGALIAHRRGTLVALAGPPAVRGAADWLGLPLAAKAVVVDPTLRLAGVLARFDERVVDAPVQAARCAGLRLAGALARFDERVVDAPVRAARCAGLRLARTLAREDGRVVDAGVRGVVALARWASRVGSAVTERGFDGAVGGLVRLVGAAATDARRAHTGLAHHYYVLVAAGAGALLVAAALWR